VPGEPEPVYVDEDHQLISEFAANYLDEDERDDFINHVMERRGYQRIESWGPPAEPEPEPRGRRSAGGGNPAPSPRQRRGAYFKR